MSSNVHNGFCNSICSHPSCWNYYRNLLKNKIDTLEDLNKKSLAIVIPHQSILNMNLNAIPNKDESKSPLFNQNNRNSADILEYLSSRKKLSTPHVPHATPHFNNSSFFKETTNTNSATKLSQLDVHEIFDMEELQSDWRRTFKAKDIYVWIPGSTNERNLKLKKEAKFSRTVKTPVLQLAPVMENQFSSSRRNPSSLSGSSELFVKNISSPLKKSSKKHQKKTSENQLLNLKSPEQFKENIRQKSLEASLTPQKMPIHNINDRNYNRFDPTLNNQLYVLDQSNSNLHFNKFMFNQNRNSPRSMNSSELSKNEFGFVNNVKYQGLHFKTVSIIDNNFADDHLDLRLGPQRLNNSFNLASSRTQSSISTKFSDRSSMYDSMMTNALSDRSTLDDKDLFPGSNMLQLLQSSYKLVKERSETDCNELSSKIPLEHIMEITEEKPKINSNFNRTTKSASDNNLLITEIPDPPPPSPEVSNRFRSISAAPELNRNHQENYI